MGYRFWMHSRKDGELVSDLFEIEDEKDYPKWLEDNPGWYDRKHKVPLPGAKKVVEDLTPKVDKDLHLSKEMLEKIVRLLKGEKLNTSRGLSLTSFAQLHGFTFRDQAAKRKLKPKYELLINKLGDEIEKKRKSYYYKGVKAPKA
jgi:hypothetical protein